MLLMSSWTSSLIIVKKYMLLQKEYYIVHLIRQLEAPIHVLAQFLHTLMEMDLIGTLEIFQLI